jgi:hypothetical protein
MICPICGSNTHTLINATACSSDNAGPQLTYVDASGSMHVHDPNTYTNTYTCSGGHTWTGTQTIDCPSGDHTGGT